MKIAIRAFLVLLLLSSCKDNTEELLNEVLNEASLGNFNLISPEHNMVCADGTDMENNEISIDFMWMPSKNATAYTVEITNLENNSIINASSTTTTAKVTVPKKSRFSWKVTATYEDQTIESPLFNFYSEGITEANHAPFPAEITTKNKANGILEINWQSEDLDDDIKTYEIYFGSEKDNLNLVLIASSNETVTNQPISLGTNYFIKIITIDSRGNISIAKKTISY